MGLLYNDVFCLHLILCQNELKGWSLASIILGGVQYLGQRHHFLSCPPAQLENIRLGFKCWLATNARL